MFANLMHDEPMHSESSAVVGNFDISTHGNPLQSDSQEGLVGLPQQVPTGGLPDHQPQNSDDISYANLSHEELKQLHLTFLKPSAASSVRMQAPARKTNSRPETPTATSLASAPSTPAMQSPVSQPTTPIMIQQQPQVVVLQTAQPFGDTGDYPLDFSPIPVQYAAINTNPVFITQAPGRTVQQQSPTLQQQPMNRGVVNQAYPLQYRFAQGGDQKMQQAQYIVHPGMPAEGGVIRQPIVIVQPQRPASQQLQQQTQAQRKRKAQPTAEKADEPLLQDPKRQKRNANNDENRLVKNRQAAQLFRQRQKQHIKDLEDKVSAVNEVNVALTAKVDVLKAENKLVKEQLNYLRSFVAAALQYAFPQNKEELQKRWEAFQQAENERTEKEKIENEKEALTAAALLSVSAERRERLKHDDDTHSDDDMKPIDGATRPRLYLLLLAQLVLCVLVLGQPYYLSDWYNYEDQTVGFIKIDLQTGKQVGNASLSGYAPSLGTFGMSGLVYYVATYGLVQNKTCRVATVDVGNGTIIRQSRFFCEDYAEFVFYDDTLERLGVGTVRYDSVSPLTIWRVDPVDGAQRGVYATKDFVRILFYSYEKTSHTLLLLIEGPSPSVQTILLITLDRTSATSKSFLVSNNTNWRLGCYDPASRLVYGLHCTGAAPLQCQLAALDPATNIYKTIGPAHEVSDFYQYTCQLSPSGQFYAVAETPETSGKTLFGWDLSNGEAQPLDDSPLPEPPATFFGVSKN